MPTRLNSFGAPVRTYQSAADFGNAYNRPTPNAGRFSSSFGNPIRTYGTAAELGQATGGMVRRADGQAMPSFNASTGRYVNMGSNDPFTGVIPGVGTIQGGVKVADPATPQTDIQQIALPKNPALANAQSQMLNQLGTNLQGTLKSFRDYRSEADRINQEAAAQLQSDSKALDVDDFRNELSASRKRWEDMLNAQKEAQLKNAAGNIERWMASTGLPTMNSEVLRRGENAFYNASLPVLSAIAAREAQDANTVKNMQIRNAGRLNQLRQQYLAGLQAPLNVGTNLLTGFNQNLANLGAQDASNTYHSLAMNYGGVPGSPGYTGTTNSGMPSFNINPVAPPSQATTSWNLGNTMNNAGAAIAGRTGGNALGSGGALPSFVNPSIQRAAQQIMQQRPGVSWDEAVNQASQMMPQSGIVV